LANNVTDLIPQPPSHNQPEYTVSELSAALKRTVENAYGYVRVRGEISGFKQAASGHVYLKLKDDQSVLDAVCWKGVVSKLPFKAEDGLEVICAGRITTYPARSNYQLTIEWMEPAGVGALMALLEARKKKLLAEGLFDKARKKPLPKFPKIIGVVTSSTGAVIQDILHRLEDRYPCKVLLWPVLVQGDKAAAQVAEAIEGFNRLAIKPDVLIVARGGGSIEDLWPFNEEVVVRAAANSTIPLISAVGHETDTTLIDFAADVRAPTPTAAAEMATPVRSELMQRLDGVEEYLHSVITHLLRDRTQKLANLNRGLIHPRAMLEQREERMQSLFARMSVGVARYMERQEHQLIRRAERITPELLKRRITHASDRLEGLGRLLESYHYKKVLERGFVLVRNRQNEPLTSAAMLKSGEEISLEFADGKKKAVVEGTPKNSKRGASSVTNQGELF
jgi:exodeoxyribonuclease VII large subunit